MNLAFEKQPIASDLEQFNRAFIDLYLSENNTRRPESKWQHNRVSRNQVLLCILKALKRLLTSFIRTQANPSASASIVLHFCSLISSKMCMHFDFLKLNLWKLKIVFALCDMPICFDIKQTSRPDVHTSMTKGKEYQLALALLN